MCIYSSVFCLIRDFFEYIKQSNNPLEIDSFLYCFLFCEYHEGFFFETDKIDLVEIIARGCPELDPDEIFAHLDAFLAMLAKMEKYQLVIHNRRLGFRFPWQDKNYVNTTWEQYEDFFYERVGLPVDFDKSLPPYFTLTLQLKEVDVGFVLK